MVLPSLYRHCTAIFPPSGALPEGMLAPFATIVALTGVMCSVYRRSGNWAPTTDDQRSAVQAVVPRARALDRGYPSVISFTCIGSLSVIVSRAEAGFPSEKGAAIANSTLEWRQWPMGLAVLASSLLFFGIVCQSPILCHPPSFYLASPLPLSLSVHVRVQMGGNIAEPFRHVHCAL